MSFKELQVFLQKNSIKFHHFFKTCQSIQFYWTGKISIQVVGLQIYLKETSAKMSFVSKIFEMRLTKYLFVLSKWVDSALFQSNCRIFLICRWKVHKLFEFWRIQLKQKLVYSINFFKNEAFPLEAFLLRALTYFSQVFYFYTSWKRQKIFGFFRGYRNETLG